MREVRGVWIPEGRHCAVLTTDTGIERALDALRERGFNVVFPAVWNRGLTAFPSEVMRRHGFAIQDPLYAGFDPLGELTQAATKRGIAVIPWFEYGFASSPEGDGGHILRAKPHWASRTPEGALCRHGSLVWMNALLPEVQAFLIELILEVVRHYPVSGIQGDDRLPAMPRQSGYDRFSQQLYREATGVSSPPPISDANWTAFRCTQLTLFLTRLRQAVKTLKPECLISMAPAPMPHGKRELMQESHHWLQAGLVDWLHPQIYRTTALSYRRALKSMLPHWSRELRAKVAPGLALWCHQAPVPERHLLSMRAENRRAGLAGEVVFHYGLLGDLRMSSPLLPRRALPATALWRTLFPPGG
jgi:uncharacterized lipoprotein YddW (UPF0748 family)